MRVFQTRNFELVDIRPLIALITVLMVPYARKDIPSKMIKVDLKDTFKEFFCRNKLNPFMHNVVK